MMTPAESVPSPLSRSTMRNFLISIPFYLAIPPAIFLLFQAFGWELSWRGIGFGALGWTAALVLRGPVSILAQRVCGSPEKAQPWVVGSSGPLEELVRYGILAWIGSSFGDALSIGLGWAAIEVLFAVVNGGIVVSIVQRDDAKAQEVRDVLTAQGLLDEKGPFLGIVERIFASVGHIGFTLIIAIQPLWLLVTIPLHSGINFGLVNLAKRSLILVQVTLALIGTALLLWGLAMFQII